MMEAKKINARSSDLGQRVKELECLYGISAIREKPGISLDEILQGIVDLISPSCQYPEITCARISIGYQEFKTANFKETAWKQACDITINREWGGTVELFYLKEPGIDQETFFKNERNLLKAIGERVGRIAERVRAEDSLRIESDSILNILKSMEDLVCKVNDQFEIEYINPALEKAFGPVSGRKCYEYFRDKEQACLVCKLDDVIMGQTVHREWRFENIGKTYDVLETPLRDPDGSLSKLSILRDLSALKAAQKDIEEREMLYRSLTESVADGVALVQDGKVLFVNNAFVKMFAYSNAQEIAGKNIVQLFDNDFRGLCRKMFDPEGQFLETDALNWPMGVTKGGKKIWVSINRSIIRLKSRPAMLATIRNVTEQVLWEKSMQEEAEHLRRQNLKLRSSIKERYRFGDLIGKSRIMQDVYELIMKAAGSDANVIVLGESGTGKELVARAIHDMSERADKPFVAVNCGAIPENLAESEFFGHKKGAFTGAYADKRGYLQVVNEGTLFLDEVAELGLNIQVKFLRALENGEYTPVGATRTRRSNFRIISATNRDFSKMVSKGVVRGDFYYRINVIPIMIASLRERKEDIPLLVEHFLHLYSKGKRLRPVPSKYMDVIMNYNWPGNVRELQSAIQRYLAVGNLGFLNVKDMTRGFDDIGTSVIGSDLRSAIDTFEKNFILNALNQHRWHRGKVAARLGVNPKTLYIKMKKAGLL